MMFKHLLPAALLAAAVSVTAADEIKPAVWLDFEGNAPENVADNPYEGSKCYKFAGIGKYAYRKLPLKLQGGVSYKLTMGIRKDFCTQDVAAKMDFSIGAYLPGSKKFTNYVSSGSRVLGEDKWNTITRTFKVPANGGNCSLMLYNRTDKVFFIDSVKITPLDAKAAAEAAKVAKAAAGGSMKVVRPLPPITDEEAAAEDWATNRRGIEALDDDFILPPFSAIKWNGKSGSVWGRDYSFNQFGLLDNVKILNDEFLAGAMEFSAKVNGKLVKFKPDNQVVLRQKKGVVELFSRAVSPDVDVEVRSTLEYDGMIKVDFTFAPRGTVEIENFNYSIPYPEKYAKFIHYTGAREGGLSLNVPRLSNTRRLPEGDGVIWEAPFKILVWLGNYDRGLLWFCESEQYWSPHKREARKNGLKVVRSNGTVKLVVTPVSEPRLFSKRTTYTFGLMATPVRPRTPGWRVTDMNYEYHARTTRNKYGAQTPVIYSSGSYDYVPPRTTNPAAAAFYPRIYNIEAYKNRVNDAHKNGSLFALYIDPILFNLGIYKDMANYNNKGWDPTTDNADGGDVKIEAPFQWESPEKKRYFAEWRKEPLATAPYAKGKGERQFQVGLGSRYQDFFCYLMEKHAELGCDGIANLDEWGPVPDQNPRHDMGYYDRDGKRYPEYDWFGRRDFLKRMCAVFYKKHGKLPIMRVHLAATLVVPIASFCDSVITGENINSAYFQSKGLLDKYTVNRKEISDSLDKGGKDFLYYASTPDRWAIEYGGQAFGWNVCVMSNATKSPKFDKKYASSDEATRDYLAMCLAHDNTLWPVFCKPDSAYKLMKIKQDFKIGDAEVKFYPYWGDVHPVTVDGSECYAVTWENKGKYLVAVTNLSLKDQSLTVKLDSKFFGKDAKVTEAEGKKSVAVSGSSFTENIKRRNYKLYVIEK